MKSVVKEQRIFSPNSTATKSIPLKVTIDELKTKLKNLASNKNSRKKVEITFAGLDFKMEVDKTTFADESKRYSLELDVTKIDSPNLLTSVYEEFVEFVTDFGGVMISPLAGKTTISMIIAEKDINEKSRRNYFRLFNHGDLIKINN